MSNLIIRIGAIGRRTVNTVRPGADSTSTLPPCCWATMR